MPTDTTRATMEAVIARLKADNAVKAILGNTPRLYGHVAPERTAMPYAVVRISSVPFNTKNRTGHIHTIRVQGFAEGSDTESAASQALKIREAVYNSLHQGAFAVTGATMVDCLQQGLSDHFAEPDAKTWQSVVDFQATVQT